MKRKYFYLLALSALTLGACSTENDLFGESPNGGPEGEKQSVTFLFPGTAQGVVPYADAIASAEENKIAMLDVYVFGRDKLDVTAPYAYLLEDVIKLEDTDLTANADAMQAKLTVRGTNPKVLYFVANGRSHTSLNDYELGVTDTLTFIRKQTTSVGTGLLKTPLLMTGRYTFATQTVDGNEVIDLTGTHSIALNRRVARFDIINDAENSTLSIEKIRIKNTRPGAYLFAHADELADAVADDDFPAYDLPTIPELMELDFLLFPTANVGTTPSAFYVYPSKADDETYFALYGLSSTSGGQMVQTVKMRLKQTGTADEVKLLPINPNTRYIINVLDAGSATIDATITVKEWQVGENVDVEAGFGWLKLALQAPIANVTLEESKLLKVPADATAAFNIAVTADTEWEIEGADLLPWITLDPTKLPTAGTVGKSFSIATAANPSSEVRKGVLYLRNVKRPSVVQALTVEQAGNAAAGFKVTGPRLENNTLMALAAGGKTMLTLTLPSGVDAFSCTTGESWITLAQPVTTRTDITGKLLEVTLTANDAKIGDKAVEREGTFSITVGAATQIITVKQAPKNLGSIVVKAAGMANNTVTYPGAAQTKLSLLVRALTEWKVEAFDIDAMGAVTTTPTDWIANGAIKLTDDSAEKANYDGSYGFDLKANPTFDERKSKMILTNTFDPSIKLELTIIQKGKLEVLTLAGGSEFSADVLTLTADATAALDLTVTSDKGGSTLTTLTASGAPGWLTVAVAGTGNDQKITVTPQANTTTDAREAKITVKMAGATDKVFTVKQAGMVAPPVVPTFTVAGTGLTGTDFPMVDTAVSAQTLTVAPSNDAFGDLTIAQETGTETWLTLVSSSLTTDGTFSLEATANDTGAARTATITVTLTGAAAPIVITVAQAAATVNP